MTLGKLIETFNNDPRGFCERFQTQIITVYVPKRFGGILAIHVRDLEIRREIRAGGDYKAVAARYGLTVRRVRQIEKNGGEQ